MNEWLNDRRPHVSNGRAVAPGPAGTIHLSFRSGSRSSGASARAAFEYVSRSGQFEDRELDEALHVESDHMPAWAADAPDEYWDAADLFERANGRLYVSADFALPRRLEVEDRSALARAFAHELTDSEQLPYTLAIHAGRDDSGVEHNPHAHILISERMNGGIDRDSTQWFRRANTADPARGGAPKTRALHGQPWMERARSRWATLTNEMLASRGRPDRVDHRSYARQGIEREPGRHFGPAAAHLIAKDRPHEPLAQSADVDGRHAQLHELDSTITALERERASLLESDTREHGSQSGGSAGARSTSRTDDQSDDWIPGR
jgi:hypothetical protein